MENQTATTSSNYTESLMDLLHPADSIDDYEDDSITTLLLNETVVIKTDTYEHDNATRIEGFSIFGQYSYSIVFFYQQQLLSNFGHRYLW